MKKQKLIYISLSLLLIITQFSFILNVKAETITVKGTNTEGIREDLIINHTSIIVNGVGTDEFIAYKVLDQFYNVATNEISYDFTEDFSEFLNTESIKETYPDFSIESYMKLTSDGVDPDGKPEAISGVITGSTLNILVSKYATYVKKNKKSGIKMITSGNKSTAENIEVGSYLIIPEVISQLTISQGLKIYGVMVGNATFSSENGNWVLNAPIIQAKSAGNPMEQQFIIADINPNYFAENINEIYSGNISIEPYIGYKDFAINHEFSFDFLDMVPEIPTNAINKIWKTDIIYPTCINIDLNKSFFINHTSSYGVSAVFFSENEILDNLGTVIGSVTKDDNSLTDEAGNIITDEQGNAYKKITLELDLEKLYQSQISLIVEFGFGASLNKDAVVGGLGNKIKKLVAYFNDPYVENSVSSYESSITIYTYGIELTSYGEKDEEGNAPLLKGAKYEVYTDSQLTEQSKLGEFTVGEDGTGRFTGVPAGTLYLKQTKASTGYQLNKNPIPIEVATETAVDSNSDGYYETDLYNETLWFLPSTGGIGTIIYTLVGLIIIGLATIGTIYYKKNKLTN